MEKSLKPTEADQLMNGLRQDIKAALPVCGLVSSENILFPSVGEVLYHICICIMFHVQHSN